MTTMIRLLSLSMGLHLCCLESLALLQVWLCLRTSKSLSLGDVLVPITRWFHAPTCRVNVWNNHVFTFSTNLVPWFVYIWFQKLRYQIGAFQGMTKWSWQNVKIIITTGVYLTRGPSSPDPRPSGPRGWLAGQGLRWFTPSLGCHTSTWGGEARVSGGHSTQPLGHHMVPNRPIQVSGGPIHPYKYPPHGESRHTTLIL
jgi:hypothetical protein